MVWYGMVWYGMVYYGMVGNVPRGVISLLFVFALDSAFVVSVRGSGGIEGNKMKDK